MPNYHRWRSAGGCYFFTVAVLDRQSDILTGNIDQLRFAFRKIRAQHPFEIDAIVVLPDHLLHLDAPVGDDNFSTRWRLIKSEFSRSLAAREPRSRSRIKKGERGLWQRRYWEHLIRDERDFEQHADYIHYNPVKHGHVERPEDWPFSSFHQYVRRGVYTADWGTRPVCFEIAYD